MATRIGKKLSLKKSLNKSIEAAGKFLGKRNPTTLLALSGAVAGVVAMFKSGQAQAATLSWTGTTNGNLSGTTTNYMPNGSPGTADVILWSLGSYTTAPTANANMGIGQLYFNASNSAAVTFGAGTSTLTLYGVSGTGIQIDSGSGAVNTGSAKFALAASQTWLNNSSNQLTVGGTITNATTNAATLTINGSGSTTLTGVISNNAGGTGTVALTKSGSGTLALSGANTYTGVTTISAGIVNPVNNAAFGTSAGGTTVSAGATLDVGGLNGANGLNLGAEVITINGTGVGGNGAIINSGTSTQINAIQKLSLGSSASVGGDSRWDVRGTGNTLTLNGYTLTKTGTNTISLVGTAVTPGTGSIDVTQGALSLQNNSNLGGSSANNLYVRNGATLDLYSQTTGTNTPWTLVVDGGGAITVSNTGAVWGGPVTLNGALTANIGNYLTFTNNISGASGSIAKSGAATLTLSGTNTYGGGTSATAGTLAFTKLVSMPATGTVALSGVTLNVNVGGTGEWTTGTSGNGTIGGLLAGTGGQGSSVTYAGAMTLGLDTSNAGSTQTFAGNIANVGTSLALNKIGAGTLKLSGSNTYTGTTTITAGTLAAGSSTAFNNTSALTMANATNTFDLAGYNASFTNLTTSGTNTITTTGAGSGTDTLTVSALTAANGALFSDNGTRKLAVKFVTATANGNSNIVTTNTNNTFSGGFILGGNGSNTSVRLVPVAGTSYTGAAGALTKGPYGIGPITLGVLSTDKVQIYFNAANTEIRNDVIVNSNTGTDQSGAFRTDFAATNALVSGKITQNVDTSYNMYNNSGTLTVTGQITGAGGLAITRSGGNGTLILQNTGTANDYAGTTTINAATTLKLGANNQIPNGTGKGNVTDSGSLDMGGFSDTINGLTVLTSCNVTNSGTSASTLTLGDNNATVTVGGNGIQKGTGDIAIVKIGTGTGTFSASSTYTLGTTVKNGTLIGNTSATAFGTGIITLGDSAGGSNNASVLIGTTGLTYANAIVLASTTAGTLTLGNTGTNISTTFSGGVTGANNLTINSSSGTGAINFTTAAINNAGTVTNIGSGTGTTTISGGIGSNVTSINQNSISSALTLNTTALTVYSGGTTLTNTAGTKLLTVSGGITGTGNLILDNDSATAGGITIDTTAVNNTGIITNSGAGSGSVSISAAIGSAVTGITENSSGSSLVLSGANTAYTGTTTVTTGTLQANSSTALNTFLVLGTGGVSLNGGILQLRANGSSSTQTLITGNGTTGNNVTVGGSTTINVDRNATSTGNTFQFNNLTIGANILNVTGANSYGLVFAGTSTLSGTPTFNPTSANMWLSGAVSGSGFNKTGTGTLSLNASNSFSGGINVTAGTLAITNAGALGSGNTLTLDSTTSNTTLQMSSGSTGTVANPIQINGGNSSITTTTTTGGASPILTGDITLNTGTGLWNISSVAGSQTFYIQSDVTGTGNVKWTNTNNTNLSISTGTWSETGNIEFAGSNSSTTATVSALLNNVGSITNSGTTTGNTTLSGGIGSNVTAINQSSTASALLLTTNALTVNSGGTTLTNTAGTKLLTVSGGITGTGNLILNNNSGTAAGITIDTTAINNVGSITNSGSGASVTITAQIGSSVNGGLIEDSTTSGLTLSSASANTFTGGVQVKQGTLTFTTAGQLGSSAITLGKSGGGAATLLANYATGGTYANTITTVAGMTGMATISTNTGGQTFNGAVTLADDLTLINTNTASHPMAFSGGFTGTGNLFLTSQGNGANTANINLSGSSVNMTGTLTNNGTNTVATTNTVSSVIGTNVTGVYQNSAFSNLILSGANTFTNNGATTFGLNILQGTVTATTSNSALGAGAVTLGDTSGTAAATLATTDARTFTNPITVAAGSSGVKSLSSSLASGTVTYSGAITANDSLTASNSSSGTLTLSGGGSIANGKILTLTNSSTGTISNPTNGANILSGQGSVTTAGAGVGAINLQAMNTYSGGFTLGGSSTITVQNSSTGTAGSPTAGPLGIGTVSLGTGTMRATNSSDVTVMNAVSITGNPNFATVASEKNLIFSGPVTLTGARTLTSNVGSTVAGKAVTFSGNITNGTNALILQGTGDFVLSGVLGAGATPTGGLTIGAAVAGQTTDVTLSGNNLFTGNVTFGGSNVTSQGKLTITNSGALGVGPKTVSSTISNSSATGIHLQNNITIASNITFNTSGIAIINDSGNNTIGGNFTLGSGNGSTTIVSTADSLTLNGTTITPNSNGRALNLQGNGDGSISNVIQNGSGNNILVGVVKNSGSGTWTLSGANTYTAATTVSAGTLAISSDSNLGAAYTGSIQSLTFTGAGTGLTNGTIPLTISAPDLPGGTQATATATVSGGVITAVTLTNAGSGYSTAPTVAPLTGTTAGTIAANVANLNLSATLQTNAGVTSTRAVTLTGTGTINTNSFDSTFSGPFTGGGLTKSGAGTLTLSGANTYTGATNINAGTLSVNGSLGNTAVAVNNTGTLGGTGTIAGSVTVNSGGHLAPGNSPGALIINNTLTLSSGSVSDFEIASTSSYDQVTGLTGLTYGGTLNVTGTIASSAHTYTLFSMNSGSASGTFSTVNLETAPTGYRWHDYDALTAGIQGFDYTTGQIQLELANSAAVSLSALAGRISGTVNRADGTNLNDNSGTTALGSVHVTGSGGNFVSEIDGLTDTTGNHDFADGYVQVDNNLSPAPTLVMLWLKDTNLSDGTTAADVISSLSANAGGAYTVLTSSDAQWTKLASVYSGFSTIIEFNSTMGMGDAFSWKFEGDFATITVDKVAVVPEPGSLGLLGLGALGLMGSRRRKSRKVAGETALSRFYGRRPVLN